MYIHYSFLHLYIRTATTKTSSTSSGPLDADSSSSPTGKVCFLCVSVSSLILKKADLDSSELKSYHPILDLSVVSKLLEPLVTKHLVECPPADL